MGRCKVQAARIADPSLRRVLRNDLLRLARRTVIAEVRFARRHPATDLTDPFFVLNGPPLGAVVGPSTEKGAVPWIGLPPLIWIWPSMCIAQQRPEDRADY